MIVKKHGIREHVMFITLLPLLLMATSFGTFFLLDSSSNLDRDLLTRGQLIARQLAASSEYGVFSNNQTLLKGLVTNVLQQPDVKAVVILNADAKMLVTSAVIPVTMTSGTGERKNIEIDVARTLPTQKPDQLPQLVNSKVPLLDQQDRLILFQPIISTQIVLDDIESKSAIQQAGAVIIEMSKQQTGRLKSRVLWFTLGATALFLLVTLYLVHIASLHIIEPISKLSEAMQAIGSGNLEIRVEEPSDIIEFSTLINGMNQMTADLQHERAILQHRIDEATEQLRNLAFYDTLTQLPNRRLMSDRLAQTLSACKRSGRYGALMFIDLDNFKPLNDQFGHAIGDLLLIEVANRIRRCLREIDTVARFGGDEFVVILSELSDNLEDSNGQANIVAEKIRTTLAHSYNLIYQQEGQPEKRINHHCTSSIGAVLFRDNECQDDLLRYADTAMYQAKQNGRNQIYFYELTQS